jgi:hypothetical protein
MFIYGIFDRAVLDYDQKHYYIIHSACDSVIAYFVTIAPSEVFAWKAEK